VEADQLKKQSVYDFVNANCNRRSKKNCVLLVAHSFMQFEAGNQTGKTDKNHDDESIDARLMPNFHMYENHQTDQPMLPDKLVDQQRFANRAPGNAAE
jgi:hypothetical protein